MADFIAPRRARLKRRQSDVLGVSYEEQRLIEKALKESLKDKQSQIDSDSDVSCPSDSLVLSSHKNVAKKSAINDRSWMQLKEAGPKLQSKRHRPLKYSKDDSQSDPIYKPQASGCVSSLPPKPSFERHSKAVTNFMLDLSTETDDDDSLLTTFSSGTQSPYSSEEEKVIVISDSSTDNEDISDDENNSSSDSSSLMDVDSKFSKNNALGKVVSPAKGAFKTQKIFFKAVKKSSSKAPLAVVSPRLNTALKSAVVPVNLATRKQPSKFARPKDILKKSPAREKTKPPSISCMYGSKNSLLSSANMLESDISSWTSSDESEDYSQPTLSKDTDRSLFQAQRKFAGYLNPSNQCNDLQSSLTGVETACNVPSTEDFILFLCLRNSGRMPESLLSFNTPCTHPRVAKQRTSGFCIL